MSARSTAVKWAVSRANLSWPLLLSVPAAWAWVCTRPAVQAVSDGGEGVYRPGAAEKVFGADMAFALVAAAVAVVCASGVVLLRRRAALTMSQVLLGALGQMVCAGIMVLIAPALDTATTATGAFPPARLAVGAVVSEPVRIHAAGMMLAGPLVWAVLCGLAASVSRTPGPAPAHTLS